MLLIAVYAKADQTNMTRKDIKRLNLMKAAAVEKDAGEPIPGLRESLAEAKAGIYGAVHTPEQIADALRAALKAGRLKAA